MFHTEACWCETCRRFRARIAALEAERDEVIAALEKALNRAQAALMLLARCEADVRACVTTRNEPSLWEMHDLAETLAPYRAEKEEGVS